MKVIIEIGKDMLDYPNSFPAYMFQAVVLDGIPLEEHCESCMYYPTETEDD